jgi:hypothetical protein
VERIRPSIKHDEETNDCGLDVDHVHIVGWSERICFRSGSMRESPSVLTKRTPTEAAALGCVAYHIYDYASMGLLRCLCLGAAGMIG